MSQNFDRSRVTRSHTGERMARASGGQDGTLDTERSKTRGIFDAFLRPKRAPKTDRKAPAKTHDDRDAGVNFDDALRNAPNSRDIHLDLGNEDLLNLGAYWRAPSMRLIIDGDQLRDLVRQIGARRVTSAMTHNGPCEPQGRTVPEINEDTLLSEGRICHDAFLKQQQESRHSKYDQKRADLVAWFLGSPRGVS